MTTPLPIRRRVRRSIGRALGPLSLAASVLFLLGLVLHLSIRDRWPLLAAIYYALPVPILVLAAATAALGYRRLQHRAATRYRAAAHSRAATRYRAAAHSRAATRYRAAARIWGLIAFGTLLWCVAVMFRLPGPDGGAGESVRVLCWNTCRGRLGWASVAAKINRVQPDIAGLVEAGEATPERREFWRNACPDYEVSLLGGGIVCLTKQPAGDAVLRPLAGRGHYGQLQVSAGHHTLSVLIVDLDSNPLHSRRAPLQALAAAAQQLQQRPTLILGDFNTPPDSVHFDALRAGHRHAFEAAGAGYLATWPLPVPVLCLDHIWLNGHIRADRCWHLWTHASDHRPVVADVTVRP